jgi:hypothetical protein
MEPKPRELHMPRPRNKIPKLYIDQSRNRAFCKIDGKFLVMGPAESLESQETVLTSVNPVAREQRRATRYRARR